MDRNWITLEDYTSKDYVDGVSSFIQFALEKLGKRNNMPCPCGKCLNQNFYPPWLVKLHMLTHGMDVSYKEWVYHGETRGTYFENDNLEGYIDENFEEEELLEDLNFGIHNFTTDGYPQDDYDSLNDNAPDVESDDEMEEFQGLLKDTQRQLYPGCPKSLLSFLVKLLHIKVLNRMTNKCYDMIIDLFKEYLPDGDIIPPSFYEARKVLKSIGMGYELIHACKNDCILFSKEFANLDNCPVCKESRWKINAGKGKQIPHKILRYFPLKPRLQRLYMSRKTAFDMRWHKDGKTEEDGIVIHPADSEAWKDLDKQYPWFSQDPRNIRLGFATDGFNPFGNMSNSYSIWPVILIVYNLPPWLCMKEPYLIMSLLIPGPRSPGKDIDVFLRPLIDELKELWEFGVVTRDAKTGECFRLHAAVLWTINDLPAYGDVSGHQTKGYYACPRCSMNTHSIRLRSKIGYIGHRRYLPRYHPYRKNLQFNGEIENRPKPVELSIDEVLAKLKEVEHVKLGKHFTNQKRKLPSQKSGWTKKSIFFELPYWSKLKLRHNLDVMHIEKNICDNLIGTILDIDGKSKDTEKARLDLEDMGIRSELHLKRLEGAKSNKDEKVKCLKPCALYTLSQKERHGFCEFLKSVKFPDGYATNISRCVNIKDGKVIGLKSHDCHVLLQRLLSIGLRGYLHKDVLHAITELASFFRQLCSRTLKLDVLEDLDKKIPVILCKLEMIFPPAFFHVMIHLAVHLAKEAMLGGPVHYRWMYPIERYLGTLKGMVRNRARPEGSIAEAFIVKECLTFCSMYLHGIETKYNRNQRNHGDEENQNATLSVFKSKVRLFGETNYIEMTPDQYNTLHWFVLNNCVEIEPYLREHEAILKQGNPNGWEARQRKEFSSWFENRIKELRRMNSDEVTDEILALSLGPDHHISKCNGCIVEGVKYFNKKRDSRRVTQNSGVCIESEHKGKMIKFYGVLEDIIELSYVHGFRCVLFCCKWFDLDRHKPVKIDNDFTSINISKMWYESDPYVLANQVQQVFYISDTKLGGNWKVVQTAQHRHLFDPSLLQAPTGEELDMIDAYQQENCAHIEVQNNGNKLGPIVRSDETPIQVDVAEKILHRRVNNEKEAEEDEEDEDEEDGEEGEEEEDNILAEYCSSDDEIVSRSYVDSDLD